MLRAMVEIVFLFSLFMQIWVLLLVFHQDAKVIFLLYPMGLGQIKSNLVKVPFWSWHWRDFSLFFKLKFHICSVFLKGIAWPTSNLIISSHIISSVRPHWRTWSLNMPVNTFAHVSSLLFHFAQVLPNTQTSQVEEIQHSLELLSLGFQFVPSIIDT
jgi:hypothetical protein